MAPRSPIGLSEQVSHSLLLNDGQCIARIWRCVKVTYLSQRLERAPCLWTTNPHQPVDLAPSKPLTPSHLQQVRYCYWIPRKNQAISGTTTFSIVKGLSLLDERFARST
jgi:hypothetical protein